MSQAAFEAFSAPSEGFETFVEPGILLGTPVMTLEGDLPVEFLMPGDRVLTRAGMRRILSIEVTRVQNARVVHIAPDSLGVGRPTDEITVSPHQGVNLRDWRARALYNRAEAVVPALRLCDGEHVRADILAEARFITLRFAGPEVIYAGGVELLCPPAEAVVAA